MKFRMSKSKMNLYRKCPRKFYIENYTIYGEDRVSNEAAKKGSTLHELFELYNKNSPEFDYYEQFLMKDDFYKTHIGNFFIILSMFGLDRAAYAERKLYDEEKNLVGIIDAIYEKDGKHILVDYKTGKYRESDYKDYLDELHLYVYLVQKTTDIKIDQVGIFFTASPNDSFIEVVEEKRIKSILRKFDNTVKKIEAKKFDAKPSWLCNYCEYAYICDMIYDETAQDDFL